MVWPSTFRVEPSWISEPSEPWLVVRATVTVALPAPVAALRPNALSRSALPVTLRSAPVELSSVILPAAMDETVWAVPTVAPLWVMVAAPALIAALFTPLARSTAVRKSATVAAGVPVVPR